VVTRDVPDHALVAGNPARQIGLVCVCAHRLAIEGANGLRCAHCGAEYERDATGTVRGVQHDRAAR
jgi:UDP-2-acetamido-3-amino-2,3-dideoxy-glucuronate N-acetyltransferase